MPRTQGAPRLEWMADSEELLLWVDDLDELKPWMSED
jgi:hypothetical protein